MLKNSPTSKPAAGVQLAQLLPEKFAPVQHLAAAHVEEVHRQQMVLVVIAEHVDVIAFGRRHALLLVQLLHG